MNCAHLTKQSVSHEGGKLKRATEQSRAEQKVQKVKSSKGRNGNC